MLTRQQTLLRGAQRAAGPSMAARCTSPALWHQTAVTCTHMLDHDL